MNLLKCLLLVTFGFLYHLATNAQNFQANYLYDENGNRIEARIVYLSTQNGAKPSPIEEIIDNESKSLSIIIYPNPTEGRLTINLQNIETIQNCSSSSIMVWSMQGQLVVHKKNVEVINTVDLQEHPNGIYILRVSICNKTKEFKIVKN